MKFLPFIALFTVIHFSVYADTRSHDRTWLGLFGKSSISENLYIWNELQPRLDNDRMTLQQLMIRPGLIYKLTDSLEAGLLYAYVETGPLKEHRPTLQIDQTIFRNALRKLSLRNRLEFRRKEDVEAKSIRYRGSFRYQHKIRDGRSWIIWDEPFLNITNEDWTGNRIFERNRAFVGMGFEFLKMRMEAGYMNQLTPRSQRDEIDHILTLYFFY